MSDRKSQSAQNGKAGIGSNLINEMSAAARAHGPNAIRELAWLAVKGKKESVRVAAIRELLDRGYGKPTQLLAVESEPESAVNAMTADELRASILEDMADLFPGYQFVPVKKPS